MSTYPIFELMLENGAFHTKIGGTRIKKHKKTEHEKQVDKLKKALGEAGRKIGRLQAEIVARDELPVKFDKEAVATYEKNMVKNESLLVYALRKATEVEELKSLVQTLQSARGQAVGWIVPISGTYEFFRSYDAALAERQAYEKEMAEDGEVESVLPQRAFMERT